MTIDPKAFEFVCEQAKRATLLQTAGETLEWDERTGMPSRAGEYRAEQVSALHGQAHQLRTDARYGDTLAGLHEQITSDDSNSDFAVTIRRLHRDWQRDSKLPTETVRKLTSARTLGQQTWDAARAADDFEMFAPTLKQMVELKREAGQRMAEGTSKTAYEALLDEYEPDANATELNETFSQLRSPLVDLIGELRDAPRQPDTSVLQGNFDIGKQRKFCHELANKIGFDFERGRLDETSHPFCTTLGPHDCRILTRYDESLVYCGLFAMLHEAGHGMYEQGLRPDWFGLPPGQYASLGIHESQSRLWENQVGKSRSFWDWLFDHARTEFAPQLDTVSLDAFHFAVNSVKPSLIRIEADEVTYNLHIIIRFDLEQRLIDGSLSVDELPEAWNTRYEQDLGVRVTSDADGVLQDVHWSAGLIGYFPTYTLGNLISAQLFDAANHELGDLNALFREGTFEPLRNWLETNVHQVGRRYNGPELVQTVCGRSLNADALIAYLRGKLRPLYGLC